MSVRESQCIKKKRSEIFSFYSVVDRDIAVCDLCRQKLSFRTSVSNLKKHLIRKHPTVQLPASSKQKPKNFANSISDDCDFDDPPPRNVGESSTSSNLQNYVQQAQLTSVQLSSESTVVPCSSTGNSCPPKPPTPSVSKPNDKIQQSMTVYVPNKLGVGTKKKIDHELMKLFTLDMQPFRVVEDVGFRRFVKTLNPSYELPTRQYISHTLLPALYEKCATAAKEEVKNITCLCLTTDCWTSTNNESFIAITGHYIKEFELKTVLLECCSFPVQHTSKNIAAELNRVVQEWEVDGKILLAISDHASNVKGAIMDELKWNFFGCMAHKINLIVKGSLDSVCELLSRIRAIVVHFKRSSKSLEKFFSYQRNCGSEPKKLILDVPTRWNSTYFMVERFCDLDEAVKSTVALIDKELPVLSTGDWNAAKELCKVLKPFFLVTKSLCGEKYAPASLVIVLSNGLFDVCEKLMKRDFCPQVFGVVSALSAGVKDRLAFVEQNALLSVAMFLDPRFKTCFRTTQQAEDVRVKVVNLVAAKIKAEQTEKEVRNSRETVQEAANENNDDDDLSPWAAVDKQLEHAPRINPTSKGHVEVRRYLEEPVLDRKQNPLLWWKHNSYNYPYLSKIVHERCCCLATSVPCERLFSKGGYILNDRRTRLSSSKVKQIMFVNTNIEFVN